MSKLTLKNACLKAAELGCSLRKTQAREFRVCLIGHPESHACYETDLQAALDTCAAQALWLKNFGKPKAPEPLGYIILRRASCGKCWDIWASNIYDSIAIAEAKLHKYGLENPAKASWRIAPIYEGGPPRAKVEYDMVLGDIEQEARREESKEE